MSSHLYVQSINIYKACLKTTMVDQSAVQEVHSLSPLCWNNCLGSRLLWGGFPIDVRNGMQDFLPFSHKNISDWCWVMRPGLCSYCSPRQLGTSVCCNWPFTNFSTNLKGCPHTSGHTMYIYWHCLKKLWRHLVIYLLKSFMSWNAFLMWVWLKVFIPASMASSSESQFLDPSVSRLIRDKLNMSRNTQGSLKNRYTVLTPPCLEWHVHQCLLLDTTHE